MLEDFFLKNQQDSCGIPKRNQIFCGLFSSWTLFVLCLTAWSSAKMSSWVQCPRWSWGGHAGTWWLFCRWSIPYRLTMSFLYRCMMYFVVSLLNLALDYVATCIHACTHVHTHIHSHTHTRVPGRSFVCFHLEDLADTDARLGMHKVQPSLFGEYSRKVWGQRWCSTKWEKNKHTTRQSKRG